MASAPWLASSKPSCAFRYLLHAAGNSSVDGVAYSAIGMLPSVVIHFREDRAIERDACDGKSRRGRRMRVHHGVGIRPIAVHLQVHLELG